MKRRRPISRRRIRRTSTSWVHRRGHRGLNWPSSGPHRPPRAGGRVCSRSPRRPAGNIPWSGSVHPPARSRCGSPPSRRRAALSRTSNGSRSPWTPAGSTSPTAAWKATVRTTSARSCPPPMAKPAQLHDSNQTQRRHLGTRRRRRRRKLLVTVERPRRSPDERSGPAASSGDNGPRGQGLMPSASADIGLAPPSIFASGAVEIRGYSQSPASFPRPMSRSAKAVHNSCFTASRPPLSALGDAGDAFGLRTSLARRLSMVRRPVDTSASRLQP